MAQEIIEFKTTNGSIRIERTATEATITEFRTCFGFAEKSITEVKKLNDDCMHFAFDKKQNIIAQLKNN